MMAKQEIRPARAHKFTLQIRAPGKLQVRKIAKIIFQETDGSLFVAFPYFEHSEGLATLVTLPPGPKHFESVSLQEGGKVTSHLVKYTHHRDGRCHFSQAGKVYTLVKKESVPLNRYLGHLFTAEIGGLGTFREATGPDFDPTNLNDQPITWNFEDLESDRIKILGYWYNKRTIREHVSGEVVGPGVTVESDEGRKAGMLLSAPTGLPGSSSFLLVTAFAIRASGSKQESYLTFIGGFDSREIVNDLTRSTTFLALSYPVLNIEDLRAKIGSIDLPHQGTILKRNCAL